MSEDQSPETTEDTIPEKQENREKLIDIAVNFLLNPGIINQPDSRKMAFLRKKGLTESEITLAYKRAESSPVYNDLKAKSAVVPINASNASTMLPPPVPVYQQPISFWSNLSQISSSLIVLGVAMFGLHYIYKMYIEPVLFKQKLKDQQQLMIEEQLSHISTSLAQLTKVMTSLEETVKLQKEQMDQFLQNEVNEYYPTPLLLKDIKSEIGSVKSMLLSRHQFPSMPKISPTIPKWQLSENKENGVNESENQRQESESETETLHSKPGENGETSHLRPRTNGEITYENDETSNDTDLSTTKVSENVDLNIS